MRDELMGRTSHPAVRDRPEAPQPARLPLNAHGRPAWFEKALTSELHLIALAARPASTTHSELPKYPHHRSP